jgi:hypothetical protein
MKLEIMIIPSNNISARIQCTYRNESNRFQVIRVEDEQIERTIAAGQVFEFEAPMDSYLDVHTSEIVTMILSDRIPCCPLAG